MGSRVAQTGKGMPGSASWLAQSDTGRPIVRDGRSLVGLARRLDMISVFLDRRVARLDKALIGPTWVSVWDTRCKMVAWPRPKGDRS